MIVLHPSDVVLSVAPHTRLDLVVDTPKSCYYGHGKVVWGKSGWANLQLHRFSLFDTHMAASQKTPDVHERLQYEQ